MTGQAIEDHQPVADRPIRRPGALVACFTIAALGAATAVPAALADAYAVCAIGLFALGGGALAAHRTLRGTEHQTDHAVLEQLRQEPDLGPDALADQLGLRPAAIRLSLRRLTVSGQLPPSAAPPG